MKPNTILTHTSGARFSFQREYHKQHTGVRVVDLLNLKSGKIETFLAHMYKRYFKA